MPQAVELVAWALNQAPPCVSRGQSAPALRFAAQRVMAADYNNARVVHEPFPRPPPAACKALKPDGAGPPSRRFAGVAVVRDGVYVAGGCGKKTGPFGTSFEAELADCWRLPLPRPSDGEWRWEQLEVPPVFTAAGGPCVAAACGDAFVLLPLMEGGMIACTDGVWHTVLSHEQMPPGGVGCVASDGSPDGLLLYTNHGTLYRVALADGAVTELASAQGGPPPRLGGTMVVIDALGDAPEQPDDRDVLLRGGLEAHENISWDDCLALRVRPASGGMTAVGSWRRVDGDGGGVPPPPMSYCPAVALGGSGGAVAAMVGGVSEVLPGGACSRSGCGARDSPAAAPAAPRRGGLGASAVHWRYANHLGIRSCRDAWRCQGAAPAGLRRPQRLRPRGADCGAVPAHAADSNRAGSRAGGRHAAGSGLCGGAAGGGWAHNGGWRVADGAHGCNDDRQRDAS